MRDFDDAALELRLRKVLARRLDDLPFTLTPERVVARPGRRAWSRGRRRALVALAAAAMFPAVLAFGLFGGGKDTTRRSAVDASQTSVASLTAVDSVPSQASQATGPANGLIAYSSNARIFVVNPDGTNSRPITPQDVYAYDPRWSPRGDRISFVSFACTIGKACERKGSMASLVVMNADGSDRRTLDGNLQNLTSRGWSPDGRWLNYGGGLPVAEAPKASSEAERWRWRLVTVDGSERRELGDIDPAWSPDGSTFAYDADDGIHLVGADGTGDHVLVPSGQGPRWSPDGSQLVYVIRHGFIVNRTSENWIVDASGASPRRMTEVPDGASFLGWMPDGRRIAYLGAPPVGSSSRFGFVVANLDGSDPVTLAGLDGGPNGWSPDGTHLYWFEEGLNSTRLVVIDLTGTDPRIEIPAEAASWQAIP